MLPAFINIDMQSAAVEAEHAMDKNFTNIISEALARCCGSPGEPEALLAQLPPDTDLKPLLVSGAPTGKSVQIGELVEAEEQSELARLNLLLTAEDLEPNALELLAGNRNLHRLSARALIKAAKGCLPEKPAAAKRFITWATSRLNDINMLGELVGVAEQAMSHPECVAGLPEVKVAVAGNCTLNYLASFLVPGLLGMNVKPTVRDMPFDQWASLMMNPESELYTYNPSFVVLYLSSLGLTTAGTRLGMDGVDMLAQCMKTFYSRSSAKLVLVMPEPLIEERHAGNSYWLWRREACDRIIEAAGDQAIWIDTAALQSIHGREHWYAPRFWHHAKIPCHPGALLEVGREVSLSIARAIVQPVKVVVCDCDNTLWGGVVGEDGWENVNLDVHSSGAAFLRLQAFLKDLSAKGVLLVAVTKNNEEDVRQVFDSRDELILKWDDFIMVEANWNPKSANIAAVAKTLNLGLKNFCFLDDSPFERSEVRTALPEVIVPELPTSPDEYVPFLVSSGLFHIPTVTEEDSSRSEMYRAEAARSRTLKSMGDLDSFLRSLELRVDVRPIGSDNINRVVQLVNKTNQFNLTTRRHSFEAIEHFSIAPEVYAYCVRVYDRFGDSGITGVLIAGPEADGAYLIDTFLLSCRVIGRTIERAMFAHLISWLKEQNVALLRGRYIPSERNMPTASLLEELGFEPGVSALEYEVGRGYSENKFVDYVV